LKQDGAYGLFHAFTFGGKDRPEGHSGRYVGLTFSTLLSVPSFFSRAVATVSPRMENSGPGRAKSSPRLQVLGRDTWPPIQNNRRAGMGTLDGEHYSTPWCSWPPPTNSSSQIGRRFGLPLAGPARNRGTFAAITNYLVIGGSHQGLAVDIRQGAQAELSAILYFARGSALFPRMTGAGGHHTLPLTRKARSVTFVPALARPSRCRRSFLLICLRQLSDPICPSPSKSRPPQGKSPARHRARGHAPHRSAPDPAEKKNCAPLLLGGRRRLSLFLPRRFGVTLDHQSCIGRQIFPAFHRKFTSRHPRCFQPFNPLLFALSTRYNRKVLSLPGRFTRKLMSNEGFEGGPRGGGPWQLRIPPAAARRRGLLFFFGSEVDYHRAGPLDCSCGWPHGSQACGVSFASVKPLDPVTYYHEGPLPLNKFPSRGKIRFFQESTARVVHCRRLVRLA